MKKSSHGELKDWGGEGLQNMLYEKQLKKIGVLSQERTEAWEAGTVSDKLTGGVQSALRSVAPLKGEVIRKQVLSHIKEEHFNDGHCP